MSILEKARKEYKGKQIYSATGCLKKATLVFGRIRFSENHPGCIVSDGYGLIYDKETDTWATILE